MAQGRYLLMGTGFRKQAYSLRCSQGRVFVEKNYSLYSSTRSVFRSQQKFGSLNEFRKLDQPHQPIFSAANSLRMPAVRNVGWILDNEQNPFSRISQNHRCMGNAKPETGRRSPLWRYAMYCGGAIIFTFTCVFAYIKHSLDKRGFRMIYVPHMPARTVHGKYRGIVLVRTMLDGVEKAENFSVRKDDIFVVSFPRSGTTWTQEIVYLIENEADREKACSKILEERFPYLERGDLRVFEDLETSDSPRLIKSHLPYHLLPKEVDIKRPKIIYVMRNPKDVAVSYYHFWQMVKRRYRGSFEEFCEQFMKDRMLFSPWLEHVEEFWTRREEDNILFIQYEDLISNFKHEIQKIAKFLDKPLNETQIQAIMDHCSFSYMKTNDKVNYKWWDERGLTSDIGTSFIRKGRIGDWQNYFTPELNARMDKKVDKRLSDIGLRVKYKIG